MARKKTSTNPEALPEDKNIGERAHGTAETEPVDLVDRAKDPEAIVPPRSIHEEDQEVRLLGDTYQPPEPPEGDSDTIAVTAVGDANRIVFAEVNDRHPGGSVVLQGGESGNVARTIRAMAAISDGRLTES